MKECRLRCSDSRLLASYLLLHASAGCELVFRGTECHVGVFDRINPLLRSVVPSGYRVDEGWWIAMSELGARLETAEERLNKAEAVLGAAGRVLSAAERAQAAAERSGTDLRTVNLVVVSGAIALAIIAVVARKRL